MSTRTLSVLTLWSNFVPKKPDQRANLGDSWAIDPAGVILKPDDYHDASPDAGVLKIYRQVDPDVLVIHWFFLNIYTGHILWISQAPAQLTEAQVAAVRQIEQQLAKDWEYITRWEFPLTPLFNSHWDLERYTRTFNFPTVQRGRNQNLALEQITPETIEHYAKLLEGRRHEFTDLDLDLVINRHDGLAYYTGKNGLRTYPLDKLGYHNICRALTRVRAYRKKQSQASYSA